MPDGQYEYNITFSSKVNAEGFDDVKTALKGIDSAISNTKSNLKSLNDVSFKGLSDSVTSVTNDLNSLNNISFDKLQRSIDAIGTSLGKEGNIDSAVASATASLNSLNTSVDFKTLLNTIEVLSSRLKGEGGLSRDVGYVKTAFTNLNKISLGNLNATLNSVSDTLAGLTKNVNTLHDSLESLNSVKVGDIESKINKSTSKSRSKNNISNFTYSRDYVPSGNSSSSNGFNGTVLNYSGRYKKYVDRYNESQKPNVSRYMQNYFDKKESQGLREINTQSKNLQKTLSFTSTPYLKSVIDNAKQANKSIQSLSENISQLQNETNKNTSTIPTNTPLGVPPTTRPIIRPKPSQDTIKPKEDPLKQPISPIIPGRPGTHGTGNRFAGAPRDTSMQYGYPIINNPMMGMLGVFGIKSMADVTTGVGMQNETNQLLLGKMGADYNTFDEVTNNTLTSMQDLIPAMNAMYTSANLTADQVNSTADTMATFGSYVKVLTGSDILANSSMYYLSRAYHGEYRAVDQYGITDDSLKNTGLYKGAGSGDSYEHFMDAVQAVMGDQMDALMQTTQGQMAQTYKGFSRAGKQLAEYILPPLKHALILWNNINKVLGNLPAQLVILGSSALSVASVLVNLYNETRYTFETLNDVYSKFKRFSKIQPWDSSKTFEENIIEPLKNMGEDIDASGDDLESALYRFIGKIKAAHQSLQEDPVKVGNDLRNKMGFGDSRYRNKEDYRRRGQQDANNFARPYLNFLGIDAPFTKIQYDFEKSLVDLSNNFIERLKPTRIGSFLHLEDFEPIKYENPNITSGGLSSPIFNHQYDTSTVTGDKYAGIKSIASEFRKRLHLDDLGKSFTNFSDSVGIFRRTSRDFGRNLYEWLMPSNIQALNKSLMGFVGTINSRVITPLKTAFRGLDDFTLKLRESLNNLRPNFQVPFSTQSLQKLRTILENSGIRFKQYVVQAGERFYQRMNQIRGYTRDRWYGYQEQVKNHPYGQAIHDRVNPHVENVRGTWGNIKENTYNVTHDSALGEKLFGKFDKVFGKVGSVGVKVKDVGGRVGSAILKGMNGGAFGRIGIGGMVFGQVFSLIGALFGGGIGEVLISLGDTLSIVTAIVGFLPFILDSIVTIAGVLTGLTGLALPELAVAFAGILAVVLLIKKYWNNISGTISGFFNWVKDIIFTIFIEPLQPLIDAVHELKTAFAGLFGGSSSGDALVDLGNGLLSILKPLGNALMFVAKIIGGTLAIAFNTIATPIRLLAQAISWITGLMQKMSQTIKNIFKPITDTLHALKPVGDTWNKLTGRTEHEKTKDLDRDGQPDQKSKTSAWIDKWREERDNPQSADDKMKKSFKSKQGDGTDSAMPMNDQSLPDDMSQMDFNNEDIDSTSSNIANNNTEIPVDASAMNMSTDDNNAGSHKRSKSNTQSTNTTGTTPKRKSSTDTSTLKGNSGILQDIYDFMVARWGTGTQIPQSTTPQQAPISPDVHDTLHEQYTQNMRQYPHSPDEVSNERLLREQTKLQAIQQHDMAKREIAQRKISFSEAKKKALLKQHEANPTNENPSKNKAKEESYWLVKAASFIVGINNPLATALNIGGALFHLGKHSSKNNSPMMALYSMIAPFGFGRAFGQLHDKYHEHNEGTPHNTEKHLVRVDGSTNNDKLFGSKLIPHTREYVDQLSREAKVKAQNKASNLDLQRWKTSMNTFTNPPSGLSKIGAISNFDKKQAIENKWIQFKNRVHGNSPTPQPVPLEAQVRGNTQFGNMKPRTDQTGAPINNYITINIDNVDSKDRIDTLVAELTKALTFDNIRAGRSVGMDYYNTNV